MGQFLKIVSNVLSAACVDMPGWKDKYDVGCDGAAGGRYTTAWCLDGQLVARDSVIEYQDSQGVHGGQACCACGGGKKGWFAKRS